MPLPAGRQGLRLIKSYLSKRMILLSALDNSLFYLINKNCSNKVFNILMPFFTEFGSWNVLFIAALILLLFRKKGVRTCAILLIISLLTSDFIVNTLKMWIARPRPPSLLENINLLVSAGSFSFPSGHATNAFTVTALLTRYFKKFYYLYIIAIIVAFSRVYLGVHFPADCLAGALLGTILGTGSVKIYELSRKLFASRLNKC